MDKLINNMEICDAFISRFGFIKITMIGKGANAMVFKIEERAAEKKYPTNICIKIMPKQLFRPDEYAIARKMTEDNCTENIVKHFDLLEFEHNRMVFVGLVQEFVDGGDLLTYMGDKPPNQPQRRILNEWEIKCFFKDILHGLKEVHARHLIHRDLKSENILVHSKADGTVCLKIADFGYSRETDFAGFGVTVCGTPYHMCPEQLNSQKYTTAADIWSVGILFYSLLLHSTPFERCRNFMELAFMVRQSNKRTLQEHARGPIGAVVPKWAWNIVLSCLQQDHRKRPTSLELYNEVDAIKIAPLPPVVKTTEVSLPSTPIATTHHSTSTTSPSSSSSPPSTTSSSSSSSHSTSSSSSSTSSSPIPTMASRLLISPVDTPAPSLTTPPLSTSSSSASPSSLSPITTSPSLSPITTSLSLSPITTSPSLSHITTSSLHTNTTTTASPLTAASYQLASPATVPTNASNTPPITPSSSSALLAICSVSSLASLSSTKLPSFPTFPTTPTQTQTQTPSVLRIRVGDEVADVIGPYRLKKKIAGGGSGDVYQTEGPTATTAAGRKTVFLKHVEARSTDPPQLAVQHADVRAVVQALARCPFLARCTDVFAVPAGLAAKYGAGFFVATASSPDHTTLRQAILDRQRVPLASRVYFTDEELLRFVYQVGRGLQALHSEDVVHRDLRSEDIAVTATGRYIVGDFALCRTSRSHTEAVSLDSADPYVSPEAAKKNDITPTKEKDVYAFGCILLEVIDLKHPYMNEKNELEASRVLVGRANSAPDGLTATAKILRDLALRMIVPNPTKRLLINLLLLEPMIVSFVYSDYEHLLSIGE